MKATLLRGCALCFGAACLALAGSFAHAATAQFEVTGKDGQPLADAVVIVESAQGAKAPVPPPQELVIDQHKMRFVPMVTLAPLGSRLRFTNQDGFDHHVRGRPGGLAALTAPASAGFELRLPGREGSQPPTHAEVIADKVGVLELGCHIHGSMRGFVYVTDSSWTARTDAQGRAVLAGLPEGAVRVRVWHPDQIVEGAALTTQLTAVSAIRVETQVAPRRRRQ